MHQEEGRCHAASVVSLSLLLQLCFATTSSDPWETREKDAKGLHMQTLSKRYANVIQSFANKMQMLRKN